MQWQPYVSMVAHAQCVIALIYIWQNFPPIYRNTPHLIKSATPPLLCRTVTPTSIKHFLPLPELHRTSWVWSNPIILRHTKIILSVCSWFSTSHVSYILYTLHMAMLTIDQNINSLLKLKFDSHAVLKTNVFYTSYDEKYTFDIIICHKSL